MYLSEIFLHPFKKKKREKEVKIICIGWKIFLHPSQNKKKCKKKIKNLCIDIKKRKKKVKIICIGWKIFLHPLKKKKKKNHSYAFVGFFFLASINLLISL